MAYRVRVRVRLGLGLGFVDIVDMLPAANCAANSDSFLSGYVKCFYSFCTSILAGPELDF